MRIAILGVGSIGGVVLGALSIPMQSRCSIPWSSSEQSRNGWSDFILWGSIEMIPPDRFTVVDSQEGPISEQIRGTCDVAIICQM